MVSLDDTVSDEPGPALASPAEGAHVVGRVTFRWHARAGHSSYRLSVAPDPRFERALSVPVDGLRRGLLLDSGPWYWRVRATDGSGSAWSSTRTMDVTAPRASRAEAPGRLKPAPGRVHTADPRFTWKPLAGRARYDLRVSRRVTMTRSTTWTTGRAGRRVRLDRGRWFWQVRAGGDGTSLSGSWSTPRGLLVEPPTDVYAPTRPGALVVQEVSSTVVTVSFGTSTDDTEVVAYGVWANGRRVHTSRRTEGINVRLACGTTYTLAVRAFDAAGNGSPFSPVAHARTHSCSDVIAPDAPSGLTAADVTEDTVTLHWSPATDPGHGEVPQYVVVRDGRVVAGTSSSSYTFTGLSPATEHRFQVRAKDRVGNLSVLSAPLTLSTARPPQASGDVRAYVLATDTASVTDAQRHYLALQQIYPTFFEVDHSGAVVGTGQPAVTRWFKIRGVAVMPRFHSEDTGVIESIAANPTSRGRLVAEITSVVDEASYDGANLDFEMTMPAVGIDGLTKQQRWDRLRNGYATFVEQLAAALHADGKQLSVSVAVNWCARTHPLTKATTYCSNALDASAATRPRPYLYDYRRIAQASDEVWLLSWGLHWATSDPGAIADLTWLGAVRAYFAEVLGGQPGLMAKVTLGTQLYGFEWSYRVVRQDTLTMPGGRLSTAPSCGTTAVVARPRYAYTGTSTAGTLRVSWLCNTRAGKPYEFDEQRDLLEAQGITSSFDPVAGESWYSLPDVDQPGVVREGWFSDARALAARARLVDASGWHVGLWRLGHEDQTMWTPTGLSREQS